MRVIRFIVSVLLVFILVSGMSISIFAQVTPDLSGLTDEEKAKIVIEAQKLKNNRNILDVNSAQKVNEWIDVGKNLGLALTSTAKELGIAMDSFLESRTGHIATYVILWKLLWKDVIGVVIGFLILLIFIPIWVYSYRRMCIFKAKEIIYPSDQAALNNIKQTVKYTYYDTGDCDGTRIMMWLTFICVIIGVFLIMFA
jgi:hypothetical protein